MGDEGVFIPNNSAINGGVSLQSKAIIGTWVDDLIGIAPDDINLNLMEEEVEKYVELEHRGRPSKLLGMECHWDKEGLVLTQTALIKNLATSHGVSGVKHSVPIDPQHYAAIEAEVEAPANQKDHQRIVGGLLYIARMTRPEISIYINLLGRRTKAPSTLNLQAAKNICRYLLSTRSEGLRIKGIGYKEDLSLKIYVDASYGGEEARPQTGVIITLNS